MVSVASLLATAFTALLIFPAIKTGFYGGTMVLIGMVLFFQVIAIIAAVVVPSFVLASRGRFNLSRLSIVLFAIAFFGVVGELLSLCLIPMTSNC